MCQRPKEPCEPCRECRDINFTLESLQLSMNFLSHRIEQLGLLNKTPQVACVKGSKPCKDSPQCDCAYILGERA